MIRNFAFSLRDGPDTKYNMYRTILVRPRISEDKDFAVPVYLSRVEV